MTTTATDTREAAQAAVEALWHAATENLAAELENDGDPHEAAKIWRAAIKHAWTKVLEDVGFEDNHENAKLRFPL
jgi:NAD-dependent oxidoreductase involved in siderophore biosynthesis